MVTDDAAPHERIAALRPEDFTNIAPDALWLIAGNGTTVELSVLDVTVHTAALDGARLPFSVLLGGPPAYSAEQGTYVVVHPKHGDLPLFLVPQPPADDGGMRALLSFG